MADQPPRARTGTNWSFYRFLGGIAFFMIVAAVAISFYLSRLDKNQPSTRPSTQSTTRPIDPDSLESAVVLSFFCLVALAFLVASGVTVSVLNSDSDHARRTYAMLLHKAVPLA